MRAADEGRRMNGGVDRRRHVRVGVATSVTYLVEGAVAQCIGGSNDIGGGGMRLATNEPLTMGTLLLVRFLMPTSSQEIMARGRIVMSFFEAKSKEYKHGIAFTQIEPNGRDEIVRYVTSELQLRALDFKGSTNDWK